MESGTNLRAKEIFCDLDVEKKRSVLGCPDMTAVMVEELLTPDPKCNKTLEWSEDSQSIFTDPLVIEKADTECNRNPVCLELKGKIMKSIDEQSGFMDKYFGDKDAFFTNTLPKLTSIQEEFIDYLTATKVDALGEDAMNVQLDSILQTYFPGWENNDKESEEYQTILNIQYQFKNATAFDPTVMAGNQDVIDSTKKVVRAQYNVRLARKISQGIEIDYVTSPNHSRNCMPNTKSKANGTKTKDKRSVIITKSANLISEL